MARGFMGHIGLAAETTWGTAIAATNYFEALSEGLVTTIERFPVRNIFGGYYEPDDETGLIRVQGDIVMPGIPNALGHPLKGVFGVNSVTVVLSGVLFSNVFTPATSDAQSLCALPPYTLEIFRDITSSDQIAGAVFNSIQLGVAPNQELRATLGLVAKQRASIAKTTPTFTTSPTGPFKFDTCSVAINGVGVTRVEALTFTVDNRCEGIPTLNASPYVGRIHRTEPQMVRVAGTVSLDDYVEVDAFLNQTERRLTAYMNRANSFGILIDVPRLVLTGFPYQIPGRDRLTVAFEGMARYHIGSANAIKVTLTTTNTF